MWNPNPESTGILFNYRFNLYYKKAVASDPVQLTTDGTRQKLNGVCDWVYEEEIFASNIASWISPGGNLLSFIQFNDENVLPFDIPIYGTPGDLGSQYTQIHQIPYPKVGTPNPTVQLFVINLDTVAAARAIDIEEVKVPSELAAEDHLIATVAWANDAKLIAVWMNRIQNKAFIQRCLAFDTANPCKNIAQLSSNTGWVELFTQPIFNGDGSKMAIIASHPVQDVAKGTFRHVTLFSTENNETPQAISGGEYVVTEIFGWNKDSNLIFYSANLPGSSESKHVYSIKAEAGASSTCMTCNLDSGSGKYWDAEFSKDSSNVVLTNRGPNVPRISVFTISNTGNGNFSKFNFEKFLSNKIKSLKFCSSIPASLGG